MIARDQAPGGSVMRTRFDQMSKHMLTRVAQPRGDMEQQREIVVEPQAADLWFQPTPGRARPPGRGLFDRMLAEPCMIEYFYNTPSIEELLACVGKRINLRQMLLREAARRQDVPMPLPDAVPRLWIISAGRPERAMRELGMVPMDGWPPGISQISIPSLHTSMAVLRDLPAQRDTLLLRTMSRGRAFLLAMHELHALPADAWEAKLAIPLLLAFRPDIFQTLREDDMLHHVDEAQAIYDEWEKRVVHTAWKGGEEAGRKQGEEAGRKQGEEAGRKQGEEAGRKQGEEAGRKQGEEAGRKAERQQSLRDNLRVVYQARFGALPPAVQAAIESTEDIDTLQQWMPPFATNTPEQIAALVRER